MRGPESVFIDADALVALNATKHPNYKKAFKIADIIDRGNFQTYTCTYVLLEAATILNMHFKRGLGAVVVNRIFDNPKIKVVAGDKFLEDGISKMEQQTSKNVSLNDCVYFAIADRLKIDFVFSFDKHWQKLGYKLLER
jgi:predicted nucleic acid-binding protein